MAAPTLIIAGNALPLRARLQYQQTFELVDGGRTSRRLASGTMFTSERWRKWQTTISAGGWIPPALLGLPIGVPFEVHAVAPVTLRVGESLPAGWSARTDWPEESVTDKAGVTLRLVYPILSMVTLDGPRYTLGGSSPSWELVCEEA